MLTLSSLSTVDRSSIVLCNSGSPLLFFLCSPSFLQACMSKSGVVTSLPFCLEGL